VIWGMHEMKIPDLDRHRGKLLMITAVRIGFFLAILTITVVFQLKQATFFNTESIFPLYILLITAFLINSIYLFFFEKGQKLWQPTAFLFGFDTVAITSLILITGVQQSIFLFLYLVNIILCGFVFQRKGAFVIALFTSACFSLLLIVGPEIQGQTLYYAVGLNNLAFFSVAGLSGYLSEQLNFMGTELNLKKRDIKVLRDLNKIIVDNISSGLITISSEFQILLSNRSALKILDESALVGKSLQDIFPGLADLIKESDRKRLEKLPNENRIERRYTLPSGEAIVLGLSVSPLVEADGNPAGYILIFQDLTEIIRLEQAMRRQEKLAAVGKLAAGIAHEIRNPLASISGSIELLKSMLSLSTPDQFKLMDIMIREISRLNGLITEFLEFVRPEYRKQDACDVDSILSEVLDMVKVNTNLPQNVVQERKLHSTVRVTGDKNKLKQVFLNLVINAYQAMTGIEKAVITVATYIEGGNLVVRVKDTGQGMSDQTMRRLFEPFFTTKPKGTGLGLATAHKILEIHDARIFVESHEGKGTEFTVIFSQVTKIGANPQGATNESQDTGS
jgi:two-component system, NtrC family, sensor histidine kinase PilS